MRASHPFVSFVIAPRLRAFVACRSDRTAQIQDYPVVLYDEV